MIAGKRLNRQFTYLSQCREYRNVGLGGSTQKLPDNEQTAEDGAGSPQLPLTPISRQMPM